MSTLLPGRPRYCTSHSTADSIGELHETLGNFNYSTSTPVISCTKIGVPSGVPCAGFQSHDSGQSQVHKVATRKLIHKAESARPP